MNKEQLTELRHRYAGMALQGILANADMMSAAISVAEKKGMSTETVVARNALSYADTLIKELIGEGAETKSLANDNELLNRNLEDFSLHVRTTSALKSYGIKTVRDLVRLNPTDCLTMNSIGKKAFGQIEDFLYDHNLQWGMDV